VTDILKKSYTLENVGYACVEKNRNAKKIERFFNDISEILKLSDEENRKKIVKITDE
jgi:hypothetical protein